MLAAMTSPSWSPLLFVQLTFVSGVVNLWTGYQSVTTSAVTGTSTTWSGLGSLLSIGDRIEDGATVEARGITVNLSGLDATLLPDIQNEVQLTLPATVWLGALDAGSIVDYPVILFSGGMDQPTVEVTGETATINLALENLLVSLNVPIDRRLTQQDQTMNWSGDLGLNFCDSIQQKSLNWGTSITTQNI
jgi:hypothetical protein